MPRRTNFLGQHDPLGTAVSGLAKVLLAGNSINQNDALAATARSRDVLADLNAAKAETESQQLAGRTDLSNLFLQYPALRANLNAQLNPDTIEVDLLDSELPDTNPALETRQAAQTQARALPAQLAAASVRGGQTLPQNLGKLILSMIANTPGTSDNEVLRASVGSGKLPTPDTSVSVAGQDRISARNAGESEDEALAVQGVRNTGAANVQRLRNQGNSAKTSAVNFNADKQMDDAIDAALGITFDSAGNLASDSKPDITPEVRSQIKARMSTLFQTQGPTFKNAPMSARQAILELTGKGASKLTPGNTGKGLANLFSSPEPRAFAAPAAGGQAGEKRVGKDGTVYQRGPDGKVRVIKRGGS